MSDVMWEPMDQEEPEEWLERVQRLLAGERAALRAALEAQKKEFRQQLVQALEEMEQELRGTSCTEDRVRQITEIHERAPLLLAQKEADWERAFQSEEEALCDRVAGMIERVLSAENRGRTVAQAETWEDVPLPLGAEDADFALPLGVGADRSWRMLSFDATAGNHVLVVSETAEPLMRWLETAIRHLYEARSVKPILHLVAGADAAEMLRVPCSGNTGRAGGSSSANHEPVPVRHEVRSSEDLDGLHAELQAVVQIRGNGARQGARGGEAQRPIVFILLGYPRMAAMAGMESWNRFQGLMATVVQELPHAGIHFLWLGCVEDFPTGAGGRPLPLQAISSRIVNCLHIGNHPDVHPYPVFRAHLQTRMEPVHAHAPVIYWLQGQNRHIECLYVQ
jgi:hypothetical protein